MATFLDVPLWEDEPEEAPQLAKPFWHEALEGGTEQPDGTWVCNSCGETERNDYLFQISHGRVFNGWRVSRLLINNRVRAHGENAAADDVAWLEKHGFAVVDPHENCNHKADNE